MYPATVIEYDDQSEIRTPEIVDVTVRPLYCTVVTSDNGTEEWTRISGQNWFDMYTVNNRIDFKKHGQALLQAGHHIEAGAELLCKRICAPDATLANIAIIANIKTETVQKKDADGNDLYIGPDGKETTEETYVIGNSTSGNGDIGEAEIGFNDPIMITTTTTSYSYKSAEGCKTSEEVIDAITESCKVDSAKDETIKVLPLYVIFNNGRGETKKRIRIIQNYTLSRNQDNYFMYDMMIMQGTRTIDTIHFVLDPDLVYNNTNMSLQYQLSSKRYPQVGAYQFEDNLREFIDIMVGASNFDESDARGMDLIFGTTKKAKPIEGINVDYDNGVDISILNGQLLLNGDNGEFGNNPINSPSYSKLACLAFAGYDPTIGNILTMSEGVYDNRIYDVDLYKIDAILDANYPNDIKRAIEQLAIYREDFMFFRDMGTACNTLELINDADFDNRHHRTCATYCTYYDIEDPYTHKQITVTLPYSMGALLVNNFNNGRNLPTAGIRHGFIVTDAIKNSIGFTPAICPGLNQKDELFNNRINYATIINDELVVESLYTSQDKYTQLSFVNNMLAVQQVVKEIRTKCPSIRYSFIDGDDLAKYRSEVERIIEPYRSNFKKLELTYMQDPYYTENKIFYATLAVQFRDFVQTEYFKVVALGSNA